MRWRLSDRQRHPQCDVLSHGDSDPNELAGSERQLQAESFAGVRRKDADS